MAKVKWGGKRSFPLVVLGLVVFASLFVVYQAQQTQELRQRAQTLTSSTINMEDFQFSPSVLTVPVGTAVTWSNRSSFNNHTTTVDVVMSDGWNSGPIPPGQSFSRVFTVPGSYAFHCEIHNSMRGTIVVVAADQVSQFPSVVPTVILTPTPTIPVPSYYFPTLTPTLTPTPIYQAANTPTPSPTYKPTSIPTYAPIYPTATRVPTPTRKPIPTVAYGYITTPTSRPIPKKKPTPTLYKVVSPTLAANINTPTPNIYVCMGYCPTPTPTPVKIGHISESPHLLPIYTNPTPTLKPYISLMPRETTLFPVASPYVPPAPVEQEPHQGLLLGFISLIVDFFRLIFRLLFGGLGL